MPLFVLIGRDGERGRDLRQLHRDAHLENWEEAEAAGRIRHGGPLLDAAGEPAGSLIVFEASDLAQARAIAAADPYVVEGIFASYDVFETRVVFPRAG